MGLTSPTKLSAMTTPLTNSDWLDAIRPPPDGDALGLLRERLIVGLRRALATRSDVHEADYEDFAQVALLKILGSVDGFRGDSRFTTWATSIAIRVAFTAVRKRSWGTRSLEEMGLHPDQTRPAAPAESSPPGSRSDRQELRTALFRAIESDLTPRQRSLILAELAGMPSAAAAEQLGTNPNACYKLYHDARKKLLAALERDGFSAPEVRTILDGASQP